MAYSSPGRIIYDDACHLKKCCVNPVQKKVTVVSKRLGEDGYGRTSYSSGIMWIYGANPIVTAAIEMNE